MLPHLKDRPLTMIRMPEGINGERFFQKHWEQALPEFVADGDGVLGAQGRAGTGICSPTICRRCLWLGQVGTLEFHVWHSRAATAPEAAGASTEYAELARGARVIHSQLPRLPGIRHRPLHLLRP